MIMMMIIIIIMITAMMMIIVMTEHAVQTSDNQYSTVQRSIAHHSPAYFFRQPNSSLQTLRRADRGRQRQAEAGR